VAGRPSRELLTSGGLQLLITGRHVVGVTTNPTIFASALAKGDRYDGQLRDLAELGASTETAIFAVTTDDVRAACDVLAPVYQQTAAHDGRVSIEVDPGWPATPPRPRTWPAPCGPQWTATTCS
jgi:transaldolase